jgi:hypothetical protein
MVLLKSKVRIKEDAVFVFGTFAADWRALSMPCCLRFAVLNSLLNKVLSLADLFHADRPVLMSSVLAVDR